MLKTLLLLFLFLYVLVRFSSSIIRAIGHLRRIFKPEDEIVIRRNPTHKKSRRNFTDGEYVDYEEVK
ncbi:hypothetical protein [Rhodoflexus sp.]